MSIVTGDVIRRNGIDAMSSGMRKRMFEVIIDSAVFLGCSVAIFMFFFG